MPWHRSQLLKAVKLLTRHITSLPERLKYMSQIVQLDSLGAPERLEVRPCAQLCWWLVPSSLYGCLCSAGFSAVAALVSYNFDLLLTLSGLALGGFAQHG